MIDPFVLLTPILLLGVMALIRFVGCNWWFEIEETELIKEQVQELVATAGDEYVRLTWGYGTTRPATKFAVYTADQQGGAYSFVKDVTPSGSYDQTTFVEPVTNGTTYWFKVEVFYTDGDRSPLDEAPEVSATPQMREFLTVLTPGPTRNNFDGWVGMAILLKTEPILVTQLGRRTVAGNTATHVVRIYDPANDITLGMVTVPPNTSEPFSWVKLTPRVTLLPGALYYIVSQEVATGDEFLDYPTIVEPVGASMSMNVAKVLSGAFSADMTPDDFQFYGSDNEVYGPLNFRY